MHDTIYHAITYCKWLHSYWGASEDNIVFVGRTASVSSFNFLRLVEGFFAEADWSTKCSQTKSCRSYWGGE